MKSYSNAENVFEQINRAHKIALSLHVSPDTDSVGANLALANVLTSLGKMVKIYCSDGVPLSDKFLPGSQEIIEQDIKDVDLSEFDTFICLDSQGMHRLTRHIHPIEFHNNLIVIDHHLQFSDSKINGIVDEQIGSCSELLYWLFINWKVEINSSVATCLLSGIVGDTGSFRFESVNKDTFLAASRLIELGANLSEITFNLSQRVPFDSLKFWSQVWLNMEIKEVADRKFAYAKIPHDFYENYSLKASEGMTTKFMNAIEGTDFGMYIAEETKGEIKGSLRARTQIDVSKIAQKLGGGGHRQASGFRIVLSKGESFEDANSKILKIIEEVLNGEN